MNWLQSILFGLSSGFAELLPISGQTHRLIFLTMVGQTQQEPALSLATRLGTLLALLVVCFPEYMRYRRENRIAAAPPKRRKRQPDPMAMYEQRFLKTAIWPLLLSFFLLLLPLRQAPLWVWALGMLVSGVLIYLPRLFPSGNKTAGNLSSVDGILIGLAGAIGVLPGGCAVAGYLCAGQLVGCDRRFLLRMIWQLCVVSVLALGVVDAFSIATMDAQLLTGTLMLHCVIATISSFGGAWCAIAIMRHLAVNITFEGFAFYNWGAALFTFILFLTI